MDWTDPPTAVAVYAALPGRRVPPPVAARPPDLAVEPEGGLTNAPCLTAALFFWTRATWSGRRRSCDGRSAGGWTEYRRTRLAALGPLSR